MHNLTLVVPSNYLAEGSTYTFTLRVTSMFGGSAETSVSVFKSSLPLPAVKVQPGSRSSPQFVYSAQSRIVQRQHCATAGGWQYRVHKESHQLHGTSSDLNMKKIQREKKTSCMMNAVYVNAHQVIGPAFVQWSRGSQIVIRSELAASACAVTTSEEETVSYSWSLLSANVSAGALSGAADFALVDGRDPRVLRIPSYALGYAGSTYVFRMNVAVGDSRNSVNATGEYNDNTGRNKTLRDCMSRITDATRRHRRQTIKKICHYNRTMLSIRTDDLLSNVFCRYECFVRCVHVFC